MSFEDIARRMKEQRRPTRAERLKSIWTGEEPDVPPLPLPVDPVEPAKRTSALVGAYLVLTLGILIAMAAGLVLIVFYRETQGAHRGLLLIVGIGGAVIRIATKMFDRVAATAPMPRATVSEGGERT